jgi:hypothetical protein
MGEGHGRKKASLAGAGRRFSVEQWLLRFMRSVVPASAVLSAGPVRVLAGAGGRLSADLCLFASAAVGHGHSGAQRPGRADRMALHAVMAGAASPRQFGQFREILQSRQPDVASNRRFDYDEIKRFLVRRGEPIHS